MRERVIVWGTGAGYLKRKPQISVHYDIIAFTDNKKNKTDFFDGKPYIEPYNIKKLEYDKIIICSHVYFVTIKYQMITRLGIEASQIEGLGAMRDASIQDKEKVIFNTINEYKKKNTDKKFSLDEDNMWLICNDYGKEAGLPMEHYFVQDIWGAKKIYAAMPDNHYDIGSRLDGFISHLLIFMDKVTYIDIRPLPAQINNLTFMQGNVTNLCNIKSNTLCSLSSFHALEHFGLGRYGDPVEPDAWLKALKEFERVLKINGKLYLGVPIGPTDKLIFNAHRIFRPETIINSFSKLDLLDFSVIKKNEFLYTKIDLNLLSTISDSLPEYSCGLFEFIKRDESRE